MTELENQQIEEETNDGHIEIGTPSPANEFKTIGDSILRWFTSFTVFLKKQGLKRIYLTLLVLISVFFVFDIAIGIHNQKVFETLIKKELDAVTKHDNGTKIRIVNSPKIQNLMTKALYDFKATRVLLMEFHNGKENGSGLPFMYGDMTIEESDTADQIASFYQNVNLSNLSIPNYLYQHRYFFGDAQEFRMIDRKLSMKMEADGVEYTICVLLRTTKDIGILFITYDYVPVLDEKAMYPKLFNYANDIANLLDYNKNIKTNQTD